MSSNTRPPDSDTPQSYIIDIDSVESFNLEAPAEQVDLYERFERVFAQYPKYSEAHIRGYPQASFAAIFLKKYAGFTVKEIAYELRIAKQTTVSTFFDRQLKKFGPELRKDYEDCD